MAGAKRSDPERLEAAEFFSAWFESHGDAPITQKQIDPSVVAIINPMDKARQFVSAKLNSLVNTRIAGFLFEAQQSPGKWGITTYRVVRTESKDGAGIA
jgi:hypothetical protein